ncbi:minor capsid protein [Streptomyces sp. NPDC004532]
MADLLDGLARHLDAAELVTYDPTGPTGDLFFEAMPSTPDRCVVLTIYGGPEPDSKLPYSEPSVQVRVRGTQDPSVSRARAQAIFDELHGLGPITLPDGTRLLSCIAIQAAPQSMGRDEVNRFEHVVNFRTEVHAVSTHRT